MSAIVSTIALGILSNLATDIIKWAAGEQSAPLDVAIESTAGLFPEIEGLDVTLREWLRSAAVSAALKAIIEGEAGLAEFPVQQLASVLIEKAGFYLPEHSQATAEKITSAFVGKVRSAYLANPSSGILHVANRQEMRFDGIQQQLDAVAARLESASGLKPTFQTHFDQALAQLDARNYPAARNLFESLLIEIQRSPLRDRSLERCIYASLGQIAENLSDKPAAVTGYQRALELDDDPVRAAVNSAVVSLIEQKPDKALDQLEKISDLSGSSSSFEYHGAKIEALLGLNRHKDALDAALNLQVPGKEALCAELVGRAYRDSGEFDAAEKAFREGLSISSSRPELQYCLAEVIFAPVLEYRNRYPGLPMPTDMQARLEEAATLLQRSASGFVQQGRVRASAEIESTLAIVRGLQGRFSESIPLLEAIAAAGYATPCDWRHLGFAYMSTNNPRKAVEALRSSIAGDPDPMTEFLCTGANHGRSSG